MANAAEFRINQLTTGTYGLARRDIAPTSIAGVPVSLEAENGGLTYLWEVIQPPGSAVPVVNPTSQVATIAAEVRGGYIAKLTVNAGMPTEDVRLLFFGIAFSVSGLCAPAMNETIEDNSQGTPELGWGEKLLAWMSWVEANIGGGGPGGVNWKVSFRAANYNVTVADKYTLFVTGTGAPGQVQFSLPTLASLPTPGDSFMFAHGVLPGDKYALVSTVDGVIHIAGRLTAYSAPTCMTTEPGSVCRVMYLGLEGGVPQWMLMPMSGEWHEELQYGNIYDPGYIINSNVNDPQYFARGGDSPFIRGEGGPTAVQLGHLNAVAAEKFTFAFGDFCVADQEFSTATGRGARTFWDFSKVHASGYRDAGGPPLTGSLQITDIHLYGDARDTDGAPIYLTNYGRQTSSALVSLVLGTERAYIGRGYLVGKEKDALTPAVAGYALDFVIDDYRLISKNITIVGRDPNSHIDNWDVDINIVSVDRLGISVGVQDGIVWWSCRLLLAELYTLDR